MEEDFPIEFSCNGIDYHGMVAMKEDDPDVEGDKGVFYDVHLYTEGKSWHIELVAVSGEGEVKWVVRQAPGPDEQVLACIGEKIHEHYE